MSFSEAEHYLLGTIDETRSRRERNLDRMRALLHALGNPQDAYPSVHVGGTSGKGSTSTMIAAALSAAGLKTGLHVKPHLHSMTERACIDGAAISEECFAQLLAEMMSAIGQVTPAHGRPSYYETLLALAFLYFARETVDIAVIEVGLGGRLDGTNVIVPKVAVITSIGYDHTEVLGDTLEEIAAEKAGIAKGGVPLVVGVERREPLAVIERIAGEVGAPIIRVDDAARMTLYHDDERHVEISTQSARYDLHLPIFGAFQRRNAMTAIVALEALPPDLSPPVAAVESGLARVAIPGRMEIVVGDPTIVLDMAHNQEKAEHLASALREHFPNRRMHILVAINQSKDARAILQPLAPLAESFVVTSFSVAGRQAAPPFELLEMVGTLDVPARAIAEPIEAFETARMQARAGEILVVTGSTFVVAAVRARALEHAMQPTQS